MSCRGHREARSAERQKMPLKLTTFRICQRSCVTQVQDVTLGSTTDMLALPQFTSCNSELLSFLERCEIQSTPVTTIFPTDDLRNTLVHITCLVNNKQLL